MVLLSSAMNTQKLLIRLLLVFLPVLIQSGLNEASINVKFSSNKTNGLPSRFPDAINRYGYLSPYGLKSLCELEFNFYGNLSKLWSETANKADAVTADLRRYLNDYEESSLMALKRTGKYDEDSIKNLSWNPTLAFRTVWRFSKYLSKWAQPTNYFSRNQTEQIQSIKIVIDGKYNASDGPTSRDMKDAFMALLRLVDVLDLNVENFTAGAIPGISSVGLTAAQCVDIGIYALKKRMFVYGVQFLEVGLEKVQKGGDTSVPIAKAQKHLKLAYARHDKQFSSANEWSLELFFSKRLSEVNDRHERKTQKEEAPLTEDASVGRSDPFSPYRYGQVCQGVYHEKEADNKLFCWYERKVHSTFSIGPLKLELLSVSPQVVKFHKIISEAMISQLRNVLELYDSQTVQGKNDILKLSADRHQVDDTSEIISEIMERVSGMRYNRSYPEPLSISSYTPGAFITCHNDLVGISGGEFYSRFSTLIFYLSDVPVGGGTGFCKNGLVVKPDKGSAILWYNMLSSGTVNDNAAHCSCPVVFGEKWIATRWSHLGPQIHLQCDKDQSKRLEYLVNGKSLTNYKI